MGEQPHFFLRLRGARGSPCPLDYPVNTYCNSWCVVMKSYMEQMDRELAGTAMAKTFEKVRHGHTLECILKCQGCVHETSLS